MKSLALYRAWTWLSFTEVMSSLEEGGGSHSRSSFPVGLGQMFPGREKFLSFLANTPSLVSGQLMLSSGL